MKEIWYTQTTWIDLETGEVLSKSKIERDGYYVVKTEKKIKDCISYKIKEYVKICKKNRQLRIEF